MRRAIIIAFIYGVFLNESECLKVLGPCRDLPVEGRFDVPKYMGTWFEIKRYDNENQPNGDCVTAQYTFNATSMEVTVENTMKLLPDQQPVVANGRAILANASSSEAKLKVRFDSSPEGVPDSNYWVLKTDYQQYSVVWSCQADGENSAEFAWILSRSPVMDAAVETEVDNVIKQYLKPESLRETKQGDQYCSSAAMGQISIVSLIVLFFTFFSV